MMKQVHRHPYYRGEDFQAIRLAYGDGRMSMCLFLPDRESNLNIFLEHLNHRKLAGLDVAVSHREAIRRHAQI